jgi:hypothetical protein
MASNVVIEEVNLSAIVVASESPTAIEITPAQLTTVEITPPEQATIQLGLTAIGIRGPKGDKGDQGIPGPNEIGGFPVAVSGAQENDTLLLKSWEWKNTPQEALTDGGNF